MNPDDPNRQNLLKEYKARINRVFDYIDQNLDKNLTLDELAKVANFSKYHFNRILISWGTVRGQRRSFVSVDRVPAFAPAAGAGEGAQGYV